MRAKLMLGQDSSHGTYVPEIGEIGDSTIITTHVGDGKTPIKRLPSLPSYDIYEKVIQLENRVICTMANHAHPLDYLIECCEHAINTGHWKLDKFTILNAKDELKRLRQDKKDLNKETFDANQES